jgi:hypothetical protein
VKDHTTIDFDEGNDRCPVHGSNIRKRYDFGSSMSAETEVFVFKGCRCAIAVRHDPVGTLRSVATYHTNYDSASGVGRLHALEAIAKYR